MLETRLQILERRFVQRQKDPLARTTAVVGQAFSTNPQRPLYFPHAPENLGNWATERLRYKRVDYTTFWLCNTASQQKK